MSPEPERHYRLYTDPNGTPGNPDIASGSRNVDVGVGGQAGVCLCQTLTATQRNATPRRCHVTFGSPPLRQRQTTDYLTCLQICSTGPGAAKHFWI
ncbi:hypothetical protein CGLO_02760 [Colletotrichum gloeosporioides Cg-14]|uniref:Uncharacterized protein n=1 Tax=Colletotrichum gloeosporioides (strain Cg-14) TaxID=1237896 RepID=T0M855_COLGC|nr:hypothetical protein CGLO_02760 [Colletotrichum gloeosporioides Cg-14]